MSIPHNLIYSGTFKWYKVYIEEEPDIEKENPSKELTKLLYSAFEKDALDNLFPAHTI